MRVYIGTKMIKAMPMNRKEYNDYRGWPMPADEEASDEGYLVEYMDGPGLFNASMAGMASRSKAASAFFSSSMPLTVTFTLSAITKFVSIRRRQDPKCSAQSRRPALPSTSCCYA